MKINRVATWALAVIATIVGSGSGTIFTAWWLRDQARQDELAKRQVDVITQDPWITDKPTPLEVIDVRRLLTRIALSGLLTASQIADMTTEDTLPCVNDLSAACLKQVAALVNVQRRALGLPQLPVNVMLTYLRADGLVDRVEHMFKAPEPENDDTPSPVVATNPEPAAQIARSYLIWFDRNQATLTGTGRQIIAEAALYSSKIQYARVEVNGYDDKFAPASVAQKTSVLRAQAVARELVRNGIPKQAIAIQGFGGTHLLVPASDIKNCRAEIVIR